MNLSRFMKTGALALLAMVAIPILGEGAQTKRPNIIMIMIDDYGYECVTANGGQSYNTPNLDQLASSGLRFEQCHVQPLCTPTRVQLMTGIYNVRNYINFGTLMRTEKTFGNMLQEAGYSTGICGKWQLGHELDAPQHFGFQESCLWQHTRRPPRYVNPGLEYNGVEKDFAQGEYGPTLVNDFALDFIDRHADHPFFLYYPMILTHDPFQPTPDSPNWDPTITTEKELRDVKHFADMTEYMDKMVGRVVKKLEEKGVRDNTLLLIIGDNGTYSTVTSQFQGSPYRGGKGTTTQRGTHVPCIVSWPGEISTGRVSQDLISSTDFLPTICDAAGVAKPQDIDGVSFYPQLQGAAGTPREWLYCWYSPRQRVDLSVSEFTFDHHFKLYRSGEFFDLVADPFEQQPIDSTALSDSQKLAHAKLQAALDQFSDARPKRLDRAFVKSRSADKSTTE